jgi:hypothetical protein
VIQVLNLLHKEIDGFPESAQDEVGSEEKKGEKKTNIFVRVVRTRKMIEMSLRTLYSSSQKSCLSLLKC